ETSRKLCPTNDAGRGLELVHKGNDGSPAWSGSGSSPHGEIHGSLSEIPKFGFFLQEILFFFPAACHGGHWGKSWPFRKSRRNARVAPSPDVFHGRRRWRIQFGTILRRCEF